MTGGKMSYAQSGYFKSPLERILPVPMEMPREHRKFSVAIVVVLDRSGSMAVHVKDGRCKMGLANLGAAQVLDLLSPMDEIGAIAVDTSPISFCSSIQLKKMPRNEKQSFPLNPQVVVYSFTKRSHPQLK